MPVGAWEAQLAFIDFGDLREKIAIESANTVRGKSAAGDRRSGWRFS